MTMAKSWLESNQSTQPKDSAQAILSSFNQALGIEMGNPRERAARILEEALEYAQVVGITKEEVSQQIDYTFARSCEETSPEEELGDIQCTVLLAAFTHRRSLKDLLDYCAEKVEKLGVSGLQYKTIKKTMSGTLCFVDTHNLPVLRSTVQGK